MSTDIQTDTPKAWVGCLGCYNEGRLTGKWLEASECDDLITAGLAIVQVPASDYGTAPVCPKCGADEFWVFDHENFLGLIKGECSTGEAFEAGEKLEEVKEYERDIVKAWLGNGNDFDLDLMHECFAGKYASFTELAEELVPAIGLLDDIPEDVQRYFDYERYGRDLDIGGDYWESNGYYFRSN